MASIKSVRLSWRRSDMMFRRSSVYTRRRIGIEASSRAAFGTEYRFPARRVREAPPSSVCGHGVGADLALVQMEVSRLVMTAVLYLPRPIGMAADDKE